MIVLKLNFSARDFMKNYAKIGKRVGRPAYRTPSSFRYKQNIRIKGIRRGKNKKSR